jgi:cobalt-zinc-cadmium efflux system membrane fusion protein
MKVLINRPSAMSRVVLFAGLVAALIALPSTSLVAQVSEEDHDEHGHQEEQEDVVRLTDAELKEFRIEIAEAGPATIQQFLDLPGEIQVNDNQLAHIVPRFSGIVTKVNVQVGDLVKAGRVLAVVESDESLSQYEMKTMINGTVIGKHITLGEAVSRDHAAFIVANMSSVWVDITVYQRDLPSVATGQQAIVSGGHGLPEVSGEIVYVAPIVNETTRTALARLILPNPEGTWRPGSFIMARIVIDQIEVPIAVPLTALQYFEGQDVVFVQTGDGYVPRPVTLGKADRQQVEIRSGLMPGERYVSKGGFTLKAELGKDSLGDGHGH